ncbi:MAG: hypothetical protein ACON4X_06705 [Polaribacter sp.]
MKKSLKNTNRAFIFGLSSLIVFFGLYAFFVYVYSLFSSRDNRIIDILFILIAVLSGIGLFFSIKALKEPFKDALAKFLIAFSLNSIFFGLFVFMLVMSLIEFF